MVSDEPHLPVDPLHIKFNSLYSETKDLGNLLVHQPVFKLNEHSVLSRAERPYPVPQRWHRSLW